MLSSWSGSSVAGRGLASGQCVRPRVDTLLIRTHPLRRAALLVLSVLAFCLTGSAFDAKSLHPPIGLSEYQKQDWQTEDGLPQSNVRAVRQLRDGRLLVATGGGVVVFNGLGFAPFAVDSADTMANEAVNTLLVSRSGDIWIGTDDRGIVRHRGGAVVNLSEKAGLFQERVRFLLEDRRGVVWAATQNGIERVQDDRIESLPALGLVSGDLYMPIAEDGADGMFLVTSSGLFHWTPQGVSPLKLHHRELGDPTAVYRDPGGTVWIGMSRGLIRYEAHATDAQREQVIPGVHGPVAALLMDRDGLLWIGSRTHGICRYGPDGVVHWTSAEGLPNDTIRGFYEDREGDIWIAALSGGLSRWRRGLFLPFGSPDVFAKGAASAVLAHPRGDLWFGTWGRGVYRYHEGKLENIPLPGSPANVPIRALAVDPQGDVWIGTWYRGIFRFDGHRAHQYLLGTESFANSITSILPTRGGHLWVGTYKGLLKFDGAQVSQDRAQTFLPGVFINCLIEDRSGVLWAGSANGLYRIDGAFVERLGRTHGLSHDAVISLSQDQSGRVWAGTKAGGLDWVDGARLRHLGPEQGLAASPVFGVLDDGKGSLWLATGRGIARIAGADVEQWIKDPARRFSPVVFNRADGMRSSECIGMSQPPLSRTRDGALWFATAEGFVRTYGSGSVPALPPLRIHLSGVSVDQQEQSPNQSLTVAAGRTNINFDFDALRLSNPLRLQFRYRLEGYDTDWNLTRSRRAVYKKLPPGHYRFAVDVREPGGAWSGSPALLDVDQRPFFYQSGWFFALCALCVGLLVGAVFRWRMAQMKSKLRAVMEERTRIAREWHDTLMADFAAISWQLEASHARLQKQAGGEALTSLNLARNMVRHCQAEARRIIWDLRENHEPVGRLSEAMGKTLQTMGLKVEAQTRLQVEGNEVELPPVWIHHLVCIGHEAVSNAARHASPHQIDVHLSYGAERLELAVEDDGCGFQRAAAPSSSSGHFGLAVMEERARKMGGRFEIHSAPGRGTRLVVQIPVPATVEE